VFLDDGEGRTDLTGRAVTALEAVQVEEGLLHRVQSPSPGHALHGGDLAFLGRDGQVEAGHGAAAVDQDRAGSALSLVAAFLGAGQVESLAQDVEQGGAVVDGQRVLLAVDVQGDGAGRRGGHEQPSFADPGRVGTAFRTAGGSVTRGAVRDGHGSGTMRSCGHGTRRAVAPGVRARRYDGPKRTTVRYRRS